MAEINGRYIGGGELFDEIIKRKYLTEQDAAFIIRQLLSAITYCHSKGVVHRDLKPENILIDSITKNGQIRIKIIDFGTAQFLAPHSTISETLGTPYYIAPEVLCGKYNEKCDIWSAGVILYILLCGSPPFSGNTDEEIIKAVKKGVYTFEGTIEITLLGKVWNSISPVVKDLIKKMLAYEPAKRISAADAYQHNWFSNKDLNVLSSKETQELVFNMSKFYVPFQFNTSLRISFSRQR